MDKKTLTGLLIIGVILFGFTWYNSKQAAKYNKEKAERDSIALVNERLTAQPELSPTEFADGIIPRDGENIMSADSARSLQLGNSLFTATHGDLTLYKLENDLIEVTLSNKGGQIIGVKLKEYNTYEGNPVELYAPGSADFDLNFFIMKDYNSTEVNTSDFYFSADNSFLPVGSDGIAMRLYVDSTSYIQYLYTLREGEYMVDFNVSFVNMTDKFSNQSDMIINWQAIGPQNEKGFENENNYTSIYYKYPGEDSLEDIGLRATGTKEKNESSKIQWIGFKQQFFSSVFIADNAFSNASMRYDTYQPYTGYLKKFSSSIAVPFNKQTNEYSFKFYFGPNKYSVLKKYDIGMERLVPLGWGIIGWVNRLIVIPVFDFLGRYISSFGLIILLLTIFIKIIIFPLTYRSYLSMAKMRLLRPEMDEIAARYPKPDEAMKKQQATMELYKKAGVSPMGGCLPLLIQFPILIAMFRFFPASIELRGESFLWADDLSSYDSILNLPFNIPFYGDHVSLFTLLMAVSLHLTTRFNTAQQAAAAPQMAGMKFMTLWLMPVMLLLWFNNYASGLSYYYLLSNIITMGQTFAFRFIVNDDKLHARMKENAKKPKKQSKWQQRYAEMVKAQQQQQQVAKKSKKK